MALSALVVAGVSGAGKTTVATLLAEHLNRPMADANDFRSPEEVRKLADGIPLSETDRQPMLAAVRDWIDERAQAGRSTVVNCAALKRTHRDVLREAGTRVRFILLEVTEEDATERLAQRPTRPGGPLPLPDGPVAAQLRELEPLADDEDGVSIPTVATPVEITAEILTALGLRPG